MATQITPSIGELAYSTLHASFEAKQITVLNTQLTTASGAHTAPIQIGGKNKPANQLVEIVADHGVVIGLISKLGNMYYAYTAASGTMVLAPYERGYITVSSGTTSSGVNWASDDDGWKQLVAMPWSGETTGGKVSVRFLSIF